jgi:hypothetical protein
MTLQIISQFNVTKKVRSIGPAQLELDVGDRVLLKFLQLKKKSPTLSQ